MKGRQRKSGATIPWTALLAVAAVACVSCRSIPAGRDSLRPSTAAAALEPYPEPGPAPYRVSPGDVLSVAYFRRPPSNGGEAYRLDSGDVIVVRVAGHPGYDAALTVGPDGSISYYLVGDVPVRGMSVSQVRDALTRRLGEQIPAAEVSVFLQESHVLVNEFLETLMSNKRLGASQRVRVTRAGHIHLPLVGELHILGSTVPDLVQTIQVAYARLYQDALAVSVNVVSGTDGNVAVLGEVARPGVYTLPKPVHPAYALALAGGATDRADLDKAVVLKWRDDGRVTRHPAHLKLADGSLGPANALLGSQDVLVVPMTGIAGINRVVDQYVRKMLPIHFSAGAYYDLNSSDD